ncbi:hypothetical protein [Streptomyces blattellae]|uniref:hypothetical protein n=1 Tax=Streptomyces blattellae TaxID=2569855 RepID=UPI0012BA2E5F|nr:hypothetical protein [Streptomyces blattellae]
MVIALAAAVGCVMLASGMAALSVGWIPPRLRGSVTRPRLWGLGILGVGFFCVTQVPSLRWSFEDAGDVGIAVRLLVFFGGLIAVACSGDRLVRR